MTISRTLVCGPPEGGFRHCGLFKPAGVGDGDPLALCRGSGEHWNLGSASHLQGVV